MNIRAAAQPTLELFIISDSVGETAQKAINAVLAQFPEEEKIEIKKFPFIDTKEELMEILKDAVAEKAVVVTTLVDRELNRQVSEFARRTALQYVDYMSPLMQIIQDKLQVTPKQEPRAQYKLNMDYFNKVEAVEFAVKYDDGRDPRGFLKADYVILGVSRTSKTPLSMYLANKSYKVANLPLIPEVPLPKELAEVPAEKLIGLTADPTVILKIRQSRLSSLGLKGGSSYADLTRIQEEMAYARDVYQRLGARVIRIDALAVEEIAQLIESGVEQE